MSDIKDLNGYEWGKEYPTNGKRPDLPDDVLIDIKTHTANGDWHGWTDLPVSDTAWTSADNVYPATYFKIIDPRYKPDEVVSESDWFDLEEMPTVGTQVEVYIKQMNYWAKVKVLAVDGEYIVWRNGSDNKSYIGTHINEIRPVNLYKEKVIEAVKTVAGIEPLSTSNHILLECLYNAGMLVLPTK